MTLALHGKSKNRQWLLVAVALLAIFAGATAAISTMWGSSARAASVEPVFVAGNPTCEGLGYDYGFKVDPPDAGTYALGGFGSVTVTTDGVYFDWAATSAVVSAVIAKGGPNANVYVYDPPAPSAGDTGLHSPINPSNGNPFGLSHIEFCVNKLASDTATTLHLDGDHEEVAVGSSVPYGSSLHDLATVTGSGSTPTGSVTFEFFDNNTCTGTAVSSSVVALDGSGVAHPSQSTGALAEGNYGFLATYGGSAIYDPSAEDCEYFRVRGNPEDYINVDKTAIALFDTQCTWDIAKSVTPDTLDLFTGDSGEVEYTVDVTLVDCDEEVNHRISGQIIVSNNSTIDTFPIASIDDTLGGTLVCDAAVPGSIGPGEDITCDYEIDDATGDETSNTATASVDGVEVDFTVNFTFADSGIVIDESASVEDVFGDEEGVDLGDFTATDSTSYTRTFTCDEDEGDHTNVVTLTTNDTATTDTDDATVTVNCYEIEVSKTADTSLTRTWTWTIEKSADQTTLLLSDGQVFTVNYEVTVDATSEDSDWAVSGTISVYNPAPIDAELTGVNDIVSPAIAAIVDCGVTFPYTLVAGGTLECDYSADLPDATGRTNTATATLQNYDYDDEGTGTASGTTDFTGTANVSFAAADVTEIDECIDVNDTNVGFLGTVCADVAPATFYYSLDFGTGLDNDVVLVCGENTHVNVADFETTDTGATGSDTWTVIATVECEFGCTLTPGYWKTHSIKGPAPYDDTWALLGEDTPFFQSGKTYYEVLWTPPTGGNAYYILAHAYIAAVLNGLNDADTSDVDATIALATAWFQTADPDDRLSRTERAMVIGWATILDNYNNGLIGPGHCSEDSASQ